MSERVPWWREQGFGRCPHCLQSHHVETTVWCTGCDEDGCEFCLEFVRSGSETHWLCPGCREEA